MPLYNPPMAVTAEGITVDGQGYVTIPGDPSAAPFKVVAEALPGQVPDTRFKIQVKKGAGEAVIYSAEP